MAETKVRTTRDGYVIDNVIYPRVTQIVGQMPKPWLGAWAAKMVAEYAAKERGWRQMAERDAIGHLKGIPWSRRDAAGDRGRAVHLTIQAVLSGRPLPEELKTEDELNCAIQAEAALKELGVHARGIEVTVYSPAHRYAGTLDLWCEFGGDAWLLDWKTSAGVYGEHAIQLAAYRHAERAIVAEQTIPWGPDQAKRLGVVHITPEKWTLHEVTEDSAALHVLFRALKHTHGWGDRLGRALTERKATQEATAS